MNKTRVFICSPYSSDPEYNRDIARRICREASLCGFNPLAPHAYYTEFLDDEVKKEREIGISCGLDLLELCDEIWVYGSEITTGMRKEIDRAEDLNIQFRNIADISEIQYLCCENVV